VKEKVIKLEERKRLKLNKREKKKIIMCDASFCNRLVLKFNNQTKIQSSPFPEQKFNLSNLITLKILPILAQDNIT